MSIVDRGRELLRAPEPRVRNANPYTDARRSVADDRYGDRKGMHNLRLLLAGSVLCNVILAAGVVAVGLQPRAVPIVVAIDKLNNVVGYATPQQVNQPSRDQIRAALADWIANARTITSDKTTETAFLGKTFDYAAGPAVHTLNDYYRTNNPFVLGKTQTTTVTVKSVLPKGGDSYTIEWSEDVRDADGRPLPRPHLYEAVVTLTIAPSNVDRVLLRNPLGIYVTSVAWSPELNQP